MKKISYLFLFLLQILFSMNLVQAQGIALRLPDTTCVAGSVLDIPIYADESLTGADVSSYTLQISCDPYYMQPESVVVAGTISEPFGNPTVNASRTGVYTIAGAGSHVLEGKGVFMILRFKILNAGNTSLGFTDAKHNFLNEGTPSLLLDPCTISIQSKPTISVGSERNILVKGDTLPMWVNGGRSPYQWSVTEPSVAHINQDGALVAIGTGFTKVIVVDSAGIVCTSDLIEVRPLRLTIPKDLTQWEGSVVDVPIRTSDITGLNITSGRFRLIFNGSILAPESIIQTHTLLESASVAFNTKNPGSVMIGFAGSTALSGMDTLLFVRFRVVPGSSGSTDIEVSDVLLNENMPAVTNSGYFTVKHYPYNEIYPNGGNLIVDEPVELSLIGENHPPYSWSVSDANLATINESGILIPKKRGTVTVQVIDAAGAKVVSNPFEIFDTRVTILDSVICDYAQVVEFPVWLDQIPADSIYSLEGVISFDSFYLEFQGLRKSGTITEGWSQAINQSNDQISFALSGTKPLRNSGALFYLQFKPKDSFQSNTWAQLHLSKLTLNEGFPKTLKNEYAYIKGSNLYTGYAYLNSQNPNGLCEGDTATFTTDVYYVKNAAYQWFVNRIPVSGAMSPTLSIKTLVNEDTITCRVTSNDPCLQNQEIFTDDFIVHVNKVPDAPEKIFCDTILIKGTSDINCSIVANQDVLSYEWTLPEGISGAADSNNLYLTVSNTAKSGRISVRLLNSCGYSDVVYLDIRVDSLHYTLDPISGPESVCMQERITFSVDGVPEATSYVWSLPDGFSGTSTTNEINVDVSNSALSGNVSVHALIDDVQSDTVSLFVTVNPLIAAPENIYGPKVVEKGAVGLIYSVPEVPGVTSYNWILPDGMTGVSDMGSITVNVAQNAVSGWIKVIASGFCGEGADSIYVDVTFAVNQKNSQSKAGIYPNPFDDELCIQSLEKDAVIEVLDATGRLLMVFNNEKGMNVITLDLKELASGFYLIKIADKGFYELHKVIKR